MDKKEIIIKKSRKQKFCGDQHTSKKTFKRILTITRAN